MGSRAVRRHGRACSGHDAVTAQATSEEFTALVGAKKDASGGINAAKAIDTMHEAATLVREGLRARCILAVRIYQICNPPKLNDGDAAPSPFVKGHFSFPRQRGLG